MKYFKGMLKPYRTLRLKQPAIYYLEEFCYKVLPIKFDKNGNIFIDQENVTTEDKVTLNFPEFLDVSVNLNLVKSVHLAMDMFIQDPTMLTHTSSVPDLVRLGDQTMIGSDNRLTPNLPEGTVRTFFGYRYTVVRDPNKLLQDTESLCCRKLAELSDDCFIWTEIVDNLGLKTNTQKPTVCKYKVEIDLTLLSGWLKQVAQVADLPSVVMAFSEGKDVLGVNLIFHPPYQGRMSFKDNIKILYPNKTVKLKVVEKITFRTNKSYVVNNKLYEVIFIDKEFEQELFKFNSAQHSDLFTPIHRSVDTTQVNSYMDEEIRTFDDGVIVDFKIPSAIQSFLASHKNYKIRIVSRDLTTQNRG